MSLRMPPQLVMVALLAEGVDRNSIKHQLRNIKREVALLAEGVDRNPQVNGGRKQ